jgi:hypothetical protein
MPRAIHDLPRSQKKEAERRTRCRDWLLFVMTCPPQKGETKEVLRVETMKLCGVSRSIFEECWRDTLEQSGSPEWRLFGLKSGINS